jgi:hypothetical protein
MKKRPYKKHISTHVPNRQSNQYTVRLDGDLQRQLEECLEITKMEPALLLRECIRCFIEEVKRTGQIALPLALVSKRDLDFYRAHQTSVHGLNETPNSPPIAPQSNPFVSYRESEKKEKKK